MIPIKISVHTIKYDCGCKILIIGQHDEIEIDLCDEHKLETEASNLIHIYVAVRKENEN